ncbi:hypothetical protein Tco_0597861 [Tanacetum coccineum]
MFINITSICIFISNRLFKSVGASGVRRQPSHTCVGELLKFNGHIYLDDRCLSFSVGPAILKEGKFSHRTFSETYHHKASQKLITQSFCFDQYSSSLNPMAKKIKRQCVIQDLGADESPYSAFTTL